MIKTEEKGVTLVALVVTIVVLLILASIGTYAGVSTSETVQFAHFNNELKLLQSKVNELNTENRTDIGKQLTDKQKSILNVNEVSEIIYKNVDDETKEAIKEGFRYLSSDDILNDLDLENVKRNYLINVEYRYVICYPGVKHDGIRYYMIDQMESGLYNVRYNDTNPTSGSFEVKSTLENNRWKIEITDINYEGNIDSWQVKYKLQDDEYWKTSDNLTFYISEEGNYIINVVHGNKVDLGTKTIRLSK